MALSLVIGAVLAGRVIRNFPYLLPNRLPGLVLYELGPALILALAIGAAIAITETDRPRPGIPARLALFALAALVAGPDDALRVCRLCDENVCTRCPVDICLGGKGD